MCFSNINLVKNKETIKDVTENKVLTNRSCSDEVHLQTLIVGISGKGLKGYVRALFDTGSQNTYISKYAAKMLKLENLRTEKIKHGLFGGGEMSENHNRYRFNLSSIDNKFNCQIEALDQTKICSSLPMIKNEKFIKLLESKGIDIRDVRQHGDHCLFEENPEEIHLLLGADTAACLFTERIEHFPGYEIAAFETNLKMTLFQEETYFTSKRFKGSLPPPAAGPERPSQDAASASSNVTRTGRVIKPPQRLDL
ncbi:DUF1758 domain-containing protein [Nephila pilipes]|uniref:DUF1758 domain-containing protein n=1 Tax=Nephila pilipes TaxID=299642 RepID=A0A8X6MZA0_NEPPI|nr:DUF1758 domain-containing protein [Nephila pilipes]GFS85497.1 DUF1758 domain-containing protein [Nephila pilipes]